MTFSSHESAEGLARAIRRYWRARGADPRVWLEQVSAEGIDGEHRKLWVIQSDMLNGKPRELRVEGNYQWARNRWRLSLEG